MGDIILNAKDGNFLAGKVCPFVRNNGVGESEAKYDILPKKI